MENDDNECTWIALEAATRNVTALLRIRKDVPVALTWGLGAEEAATGLASEDATNDGGDSPGLQADVTEGSLSPEGQRVVIRPGETELRKFA